MVLEGISISWSELLAIIIGIPTAITIPLTVFLMKIKGTGEDNTKAIMQNDQCIARLEDKIDKGIDATKLQFKEENINLVKNIAVLSSDIKALNVAIGVLTDKTNTSEKIHTEIRAEEKDIKQFFTDWIQRVEDLLRDQRAGINVGTTNTTSYTDIDRRLDSLERILMKLVNRDERNRMS